MIRLDGWMPVAVLSWVATSALSFGWASARRRARRVETAFADFELHASKQAPPARSIAAWGEEAEERRLSLEKVQRTLRDVADAGGRAAFTGGKPDRESLLQPAETFWCGCKPGESVGLHQTLVMDSGRSPARRRVCLVRALFEDVQMTKRGGG